VSKDKDQPKTGTGNKHGKPYTKSEDVKRARREAHRIPSKPDGKHRKPKEE
jgi:hypothetical protein